MPGNSKPMRLSQGGFGQRVVAVPHDLVDWPRGVLSVRVAAEVGHQAHRPPKGSGPRLPNFRE